MQRRSAIRKLNKDEKKMEYWMKDALNCPTTNYFNDFDQFDLIWFTEQQQNQHQPRFMWCKLPRKCRKWIDWMTLRYKCRAKQRKRNCVLIFESFKKYKLITELNTRHVLWIFSLGTLTTHFALLYAPQGVNYVNINQYMSDTCWQVRFGRGKLVGAVWLFYWTEPARRKLNAWFASR